MCLSGQQRKELQSALIDAFPTTASLEQMLAFGLNRNLRAIAGEGSLQDIVFKLIQIAEARYILDELIIGAIRENPTNIRLQNLANNINNIQSAVNSQHPLSEDWDLLLPILQKIEFNAINEVLIQVLSKRIKEILYLKEIEREFEYLQRMNIPEHKKSLQLFVTKKLLLLEYKELDDGTKTVVKFVQDLANKIGKEELIRSDLENWVEKTVRKHNITTPTFSDCQLPKELYSYLLVIIQPENNKYRINAYLIPNDEDKNNIEPVDIESKEKGFLCCSFDEIETRIPDLITASFKIIELYKQRTKKKIECYLTIQFFLPIEHLNKTVEQWKRSHNLDLLIGEEYRVVVRSYDRVKDPEMGNHLIKGIKRLNDVQKKIKSPISEEVCEHLFEHLKEKELDTLNWKDLRHKLQENKIGLKLYCSLPPPVTNQYKKLYQAILRSGTPIVIWKRNSNLLEQEFQSFLKIRSLKNCQIFFELLQEMRKTAYMNEEKREDYLGYHLGVLYEEPNLEDFPDLKAAIANL